MPAATCLPQRWDANFRDRQFPLDTSQYLRSFALPDVQSTHIYSSRSYADNALVQPAAREAFRRLLAQGWSDARPVLHPDAAIYTFWDYMRKRWERDVGLRIDHLLLSPQLAMRLVACEVDKPVRGERGASDHAPVWIEVGSAVNPLAAGKRLR